VTEAKKLILKVFLDTWGIGKFFGTGMYGVESFVAEPMLRRAEKSGVA